MKKYIIERDLPGAGKLTKKELREISDTSIQMVGQLDKPYQWLETYVTNNKLFCIHIAPDEETIREHSKRAGFPIGSIREITTIIDPSTSKI